MKLGNLSTCTARRLVHCHNFFVTALPLPSSPIYTVDWRGYFYLPSLSRDNGEHDGQLWDPEK